MGLTALRVSDAPSSVVPVDFGPPHGEHVCLPCARQDRKPDEIMGGGIGFGVDCQEEPWQFVGSYEAIA